MCVTLIKRLFLLPFQTKQLEADRSLFEKQLKQEKESAKKIQTDFDKEKKECLKWESKVSDLDADLSVSDKLYSLLNLLPY